MAVATFDSLKYAKTLKASGVPEGQADAHSQALNEALQSSFRELVTKDDLKMVIDAFRTEMKSGFDLVRADMRNMEDRLTAAIRSVADQSAAALKNATDQSSAALKNSTDQLRHEIKEVEQKLTSKLDFNRWLLNFGLVGTVLLIARVLFWKTPLW